MQMIDDLKTIAVYSLKGDLAFLSAVVCSILAVMSFVAMVISGSMLIFILSHFQTMSDAEFAVFTPRDVFILNLCSMGFLMFFPTTSFLTLKLADDYFTSVEKIKPIEEAKP